MAKMDREVLSARITEWERLLELEDGCRSSGKSLLDTLHDGFDELCDFYLQAAPEQREAIRETFSKIRRELYGPPADVTKEPGWPEGLSADTVFDVDVVGQKTVRAPAGEPLMNTLERYGIAVPAICRSGACSACHVRLLSGRVFQPAHTGLRESDRKHGYI